MQVTIYVDGSFGNDGCVHGGVVYYINGEKSMLHVISKNPNLVDMRNVGGEILAAYTAMLYIVSAVKDLNKPVNIKLVYDYKGIGCWLKGEWRAKKLATKWFVGIVRNFIKMVPLLTIKYEQVSGHSGVEGNELADSIADYTMNFTRLNNIPIQDMDNLVQI